MARPRRRQRAATELAPAAAENHAPRWAPDSASVFFLSDRAGRGTARLYRVGLTGGDPEPLTAAGIREHAPLTDPEQVVVIAPEERTGRPIPSCLTFELETGRHRSPPP